jgi:hypothetical protein
MVQHEGARRGLWADDDDTFVLAIQTAVQAGFRVEPALALLAERKQRLAV